jgi:hypothetical protein
MLAALWAILTGPLGYQGKGQEETRMKSLACQQVDVFTAVPFKGNPVAVVIV